MARLTIAPGLDLDVRTEMLDVTTNLPQPDPRWSYTDEHGHEHAYGHPDDPYPTLARRYSETYWCDDCDDEHWDTWLECPQCGEKIEPRAVVDNRPREIPGRTEYLLYGKPITNEEGEQLLAEQRAAQAEQDRAARARKLVPVAEAMRAEGLADDVIQRVLARLEARPSTRPTTAQNTGQ